MLSGRMAARVDRGVAPRRVMGWVAGDVTGMLPYSRMKAPPGDNYLEERSEALEVHERLFPEMIQRCPLFTAYTVHLMLDRARSFSASDLQDEKMVSLGKLAAGLAHELNNPASAAVRGAKVLLSGLDSSDDASRKLGAAGLSADVLNTIGGIRAACMASVLSPVEQANREDEIATWLGRHQLDEVQAAQLADAGITIAVLDTLAEAIPGEALDAALRWVAAGCETHTLAADIERAATRIYELVAAVKKFTYMDNLAGPEAVDVEAGLRDTLEMVTSKANSKETSIVLAIEPGFPVCTRMGGISIRCG